MRTDGCFPKQKYAQMQWVAIKQYLMQHILKCIFSKLKVLSAVDIVFWNLKKNIYIFSS